MAGGDDGGGGGGAQDDFFDQMLSTLPSAWADLGGAGGKSPWEIAAGAEDLTAFDESALLASRLRQHQIGGGEKPVMLQLTDLQRQSLAGGGEESGGGGFSPLPLFTDRSPPTSREDMEGGFKSPNGTVGSFLSISLSPIFEAFPLTCMDSSCARACMQGGDHAMFNGFGAHGGAGGVQPPFGQVRSCTVQLQEPAFSLSFSSLTC
jgi:hypothetical protein